MNHIHCGRSIDLPFWGCCTLYVLVVACAVNRAVSSSHAQVVAAAPENGGRVTDIWRGMFTDQQAERGRAVFEAHCAACHDGNKSGEAPALAGDTFFRNWEGHTAGRLYTKILEMMPPTDVQSVNASQKLDVLTFILRENGFPAGAADLTADADALGRIRIVPEGGPARLRSGAMVHVVGCLTKTSPNAWLLTNSTEPEATTLERSGGALDTSWTRTLGTESVRLLSVFPSPEPLIGHRVEAKGLFVRTGTDIAVNVVSLRSLAASCP